MGFRTSEAALQNERGVSFGVESADPADEIAHEKFVTSGVEMNPAYRGTSLIRNTHTPRIIIGP